MRGRTNVTQRSGTVPVNGQVKQYEVATGNTIAAGDFVTTITESVETNIASLNSTSSYTGDYSNKLHQREIGEINGKKVFYFYSYEYRSFSNFLFIIKDTNGDVFSVLNYTPARIDDNGPACVIGNYIILSDYYDSISNNKGLKVLKLSDDLQTYDIVQDFKNDYTLGLFGIFKISDSKFVTICYTNDTLKGFALYSFNNGQITLLQYSANSNIPGYGNYNCYGIASDDGNSIYITFIKSNNLCCATVKINGDNIESSNVVNTSTNVEDLTLSKICKLPDNNYFCLGYYNSLNVIMFSVSDSGNFGLKSVSSLTDLNESNSIAKPFDLASNGDGSYFVIYYVSRTYFLRACKISLLNNSVNIDVKYGSLNSNYHKYYSGLLVDKSGDKYFIRYVQKYGNGSGETIDSSVYFITEMKATTTGETIDLGGGLKVSSYNGKSIGFAKTGGTAGQTIQVYVPNES